MKSKNKKGFTLIELLAVIVILGVLMAIAIPSMTGYIANSKKDTLLNSAQQLLSGAKDMLTSENAYPGPGTAIFIDIDDIELDKGGVSPYDNKPFKDGKSYVLVYNSAATESAVKSSSYEYYIALEDNSGNCMEPVSESFLTSAKTKTKRGLIKGGSTCITTAAAGSDATVTFKVFKTSAETNTTISPTKVTKYES